MSSLNEEFQLQQVFQYMSSAVLMFVSAMLGWAALHYFKVQSQVKSPCKAALFAAEQVHTLQHQEDIADLQTPENAPQAYAEDIEADIAEVRAVGNTEPTQPQHQAKVDEPNLQFDVSEQLAKMRRHAAARNIKDTLSTFKVIKKSGTPLTSSMYNTVMQAWINCGNIYEAEDMMDEMKEAGMADEESFIILVKALLRILEFEKAKKLLNDMREAAVSPSSAMYDELIRGFARNGLFNDGISLLNEMHAAGVQPTSRTRKAITDLMNHARKVNQSFANMRQIFERYGVDPKNMSDCLRTETSETPRLVAVILQAENAMPCTWVHAVEVTGSLAHIEAVQRTLKQHGLGVQVDENDASPQRMDVIIDGVHTSISSPVLTQTSRDETQDAVYRGRAKGVMKSVSKGGLGMPLGVENELMQYLGSDLYYLHVDFQSQTHRADMFDALSCRHPLVGLRHCWAKAGADAFGQRTLVNGNDTSEACFKRHTNVDCQA